jgi:putative transcriptional regulator
MFRVDAGLSRRDLAKSVGANPQTIGFLERGDYKPSLELALAICEVFDVPVEMVFSFEPFPSLSQALQKGRTG